MNMLKLRTSRENYYLECPAAYDGMTFAVTEDHLDVLKGGEAIRHIPLTTKIKLELNRIRSNEYLKTVPWATMFSVWLIALDDCESVNKCDLDSWSLMNNSFRNRLENGMIQTMVEEQNA